MRIAGLVGKSEAHRKATGTLAVCAVSIYVYGQDVSTI
jgi:hypothetical protein